MRSVDRQACSTASFFSRTHSTVNSMLSHQITGAIVITFSVLGFIGWLHTFILQP